MDRRTAILERGYFVLRGFLSTVEAAGFADDYRRGIRSDNKVYTLGIADPTKIAAFEDRIEAVLREIRVPGKFTPRHTAGGAYFSTEHGIDFPWHQDHESYFINQTHENYVNLYIPIIKPERARSNLMLVPADRLAARAPELWQELAGRGAVSAIEEAGRTLFRDDHAGGCLGELDFPLDEIADTPELAAGDALFMRGDLLHRTQDADTNRVALSIRIWDPADVIKRTHFETSCAVKDWYKERNPRVYGNLAAVFADHGELTLGELTAAIRDR